MKILTATTHHPKGGGPRTVSNFKFLKIQWKQYHTKFHTQKNAVKIALKTPCILSARKTR